MIDKKINKIIEEIEKANKLIENKKNLNLKNITKLCKEYNEIILKLENNNFIMINELEKISFDKNLEKENNEMQSRSFLNCLSSSFVVLQVVRVSILFIPYSS